MACFPYLSGADADGSGMQSSSLKCFGVGDGMACADRNHSSYLYQLGSVNLLFDTGEPISRSYKASGLSYELIDRIVLSHLHSDHIGGFFMLMQGFWLERRKRNLHVHLPAEGIAPLRAMLRAAYLFDEVLPFPLVFEPLRAGQTFAEGEVKITPHPTSHLESLRQAYQAKYPAEFAAFSFVLETGQGRIAHTADLGAVKDLDPLVAQPLDVLVCELAHYRPEELFDYLRGRRIGHLVLMHLGRSHWEKFSETQALARKSLPGMRVTFPRDQDLVGF
jgi:ribonuclease Z